MHTISYRSSAYDFGLRANLQDDYLTNSDLSARFSQLEKHQPDIAEFIPNNSAINAAIHSLKITHNVSLILSDSRYCIRFIQNCAFQMGSPDENKFRIALVGGLFASQPAGREILLRLATHILMGNQIGNPPIQRMLDNAILHIIPAVDPKFDDIKESKDCNPVIKDEIGETLLLNSDTSNGDAFKAMLQNENYDAVVILGSGASQIR